MEELRSANAKAEAQSALFARLTAALAPQGDRQASYRGGGGSYPVWSNGPGDLYFAYRAPNASQKIRRHWHAFGYYAHTGQLRIVVEINIASQEGQSRAEGFFARDPDSGTILLMHSGLMGGGVKGLTQAAFLAWSGDEPRVVRSGDKSRLGFVVADIGSEDLISQIGEFVRRVALFKHDLGSGLLEQTGFKRKVSQARTLMQEFVGRKSGQRSADFSYETFHGAVVEALAEERAARLKVGETVDKTVLIDLFVCMGTRLTEVYEVKSKVDRTSLYGAIGQLVTHCGEEGRNVQRTLVLPKGRIVSDIGRALAREEIGIRRYRLVGKGQIKRVKLL